MSGSCELQYFDSRYGDTYVIEARDGQFVSALRHVGRVGSDPIHYDKLWDIPEPHRTAILQLIHERCPKPI